MSDQTDEGAAHAAPAEGLRADVELRLPGDGAYASVLRATAAAIAARLEFTVDDIEDLRIAVGEAGALVLPEADPGSDLTTRFYLGRGTITVEIAAGAVDEPAPDHDSFAWQVLTTLADGAEAASGDGTFRVRFTLTAHTAPGAAGTGL